MNVNEHGGLFRWWVRWRIFLMGGLFIANTENALRSAVVGDWPDAAMSAGLAVFMLWLARDRRLETEAAPAEADRK